ncbi:MAG: hypothetical protein IJ092_06165 [Atopobiaceae bacterium]|nr:hypothetical protein [Atopobiaceae bacterium]MBR1830394.1 hypothetical protein [Atopobiaceae bacterium]
MDVASEVRQFISRAKSGSVKRMLLLARQAHEESGKPTALVFADMASCILRYGIGYQEYISYGFVNKPESLRKTFMTMSHNVALTRALCDRSLYPVFEDKILFLKTFDRYVGRDWLDVKAATPEEVAAFMRDHDAIFAKPTDSFGGQGIDRLSGGEAPQDAQAFYDGLLSKGQVLLEEGIVQHPEMARLCDKSINTIRVVTVLSQGKAHHIYSLVRMGLGDSYVDNISSGGMYTLVDDDGVLRHPCFHDKTASYVDVHPKTGVKIEGFVIPLYREAVDMCLEAALVEPRIGYVGWDVAITPTGPVLVEGNLIPGYDMPQTAAFHPDGKGILPVFEEALGYPVPR